MINKEHIIFQAKVSGYNVYFDGEFISIYDEDATVSKDLQCVLRVKADCSSKKDFELETIYVISSLNNY